VVVQPIIIPFVTGWMIGGKRLDEWGVVSGLAGIGLTRAAQAGWPYLWYDIKWMGAAARGTYTGSVLLGYGAGVIGATAIGYMMHGDKGAKDAFEFTTGQRGIKEPTMVIVSGLKKQAVTYSDRQAGMTWKEKATEEAISLALGPVWGPAYKYFQPENS